MMILLDILEKGQKKNASDIHLVNNEKVIYRVNGELIRDEENGKVSEESLINFIRELFTEKQKEIFEKNKEIDISFEDIKKRRYRINLYNEKSFPAFSIRILTKKIQNFEELKLPEILKNMIEYENGLVLVTGPTGSGKSTTLAAMIEEINQREALSIVTIEDPVEYIFENKKYETETVSQEAYELCKTDLARRAAKENDLMTLAKENAVTAVEALVDPWVQQIDGEYKVNIK